MQHAIDTAVRTSEDRAVLDGVRWCHEHGATVRWRTEAATADDAACVVEVLAPGTDWNLLRGCGVGFLEAYAAVREKHDTWARDVAGRGRGPATRQRWSA